MCEACDEKDRLIDMLLESPRPCLVCDSTQIIGIETWIPEKEYILAVGGKDHNPIFAYCLCAEHADPTPANEKKKIQAIIRDVRAGNTFKRGE